MDLTLIIFLVLANRDVWTSPIGESEISLNSEKKKKKWIRISCYFGRLKFQSLVVAVKHTSFVYVFRFSYHLHLETLSLFPLFSFSQFLLVVRFYLILLAT